MNKSELSKKQLKEVIKNAGPSEDIRIILKYDGQFESISLEEFNNKHMINGRGCGYVARSETFDAHNGYTGPDAAKDEEFVAMLFRRFSNAWDEHNRTSRDTILADEMYY